MIPSASRKIGQQWRGISLRAQALIFVGGALLIGSLIYYLVMSTAINGSLRRLQDEIAYRRVERAVFHLEQIARAESVTAQRLATSNGAYSFVQGKNPRFLNDTIDNRFVTGSPELVAVFNSDRALYAAISNDGQTGPVSGLPLGLPAAAFRNSPLLVRTSKPSAISVTPKGLWILTSAPIVRSDGTGPSTGWLVLGRFVGPAPIDKILATTGALVAPSPKAAIKADRTTAQGVRKNTSFGNFTVFMPSGPFSPTNDQEVIVEVENGLGGSPARFAVQIPPVVASTADELRQRVVILTLVGGIVLIGAVLASTEILFVRRISKMNRRFQALAVSSASAQHFEVSGTDEFARLSQSANRLLNVLRRRSVETENQQQLLAGVLDSATGGIMAFRSRHGADGKIDDFILVVANKAASKIVGRNVEDMVGRPLLTLFPGNRKEGLFDSYCRVVETGQADEREFYYEHENLKAWFHSSATRWKDGFVVTFEPITERKNAERELQRNLTEIERFNAAMIGREERILEMKSEVNTLRRKLGMPPAYNVDSFTDA